MGRAVNPNKPYRGLSAGERRVMLRQLNLLQERDGVIYERDLPAWWIPKLMQGQHVRRIEKGVLTLTHWVKEAK